MSNLLNDAIKYFNNKSSIADNESVDIIERVHAKLSAIAVEITLINTFISMSYDRKSRKDSECKYEIFAKVKNTKEKEFSELAYYTSYKLEHQYEILSYEYGKLLGLPDEKIINKTLPQFYDIRSATNLICTTGKTIEQQFDSFYDENENRYPLFCKREEDGSLSYPQENYTIWGHRNFDLDDVPSKYKDWREEYYSYNDEIANTIVEFFKYYFENPNKKEDEDYLRNNKIVGPDDYMPHGRKVEFSARTLSEKQSLDNLLAALYKNKSK